MSRAAVYASVMRGNEAHQSNSGNAQRDYVSSVVGGRNGGRVIPFHGGGAQRRSGFLAFGALSYMPPPPKWYEYQK